MRVFFLQSVLWFAAVPLLVSGAEPYWVNSVVVSETAPIRIQQTPISSDVPFLSKPQIIERRILSTRIISPLPVVEEIQPIQNPVPLQPLRYEKNVESSEILPVSTTIESELIDKKEKPFPEITLETTFVSDEKSNQTLVLKPPFEETSPKFPQLSAQAVQIPTEQVRLPEPKKAPPSTTILGQSPTSIAGAVEEALKELPPYPQGTVDPAMIDPKLTETAPAEEQPLEAVSAALVTASKPGDSGTKRASWADGALLLATIVSILMLVYAVVMVFDYRQRWMQSLLAQNSRLGSFDDDMELGYSSDGDLYGGTTTYGTGSDLGRRRFGTEMFESPMRY